MMLVQTESDREGRLSSLPSSVESNNEKYEETKQTATACSNGSSIRRLSFTSLFKEKTEMRQSHSLSSLSEVFRRKSETLTDSLPRKEKRNARRYSLWSKTVSNARLFCSPELSDVDIGAKRSKQLKCPGKHTLAEFSVPHMQFTCDLCEGTLHQGDTVFSCRECNFDVCQTCGRRCQECGAGGMELDVLQFAIGKPSESVGMMLRKNKMKTIVIHGIRDDASSEVHTRFEAGDQILTMNGRAYSSAVSLAVAMKSLKVGTNLKFKLARGALADVQSGQLKINLITVAISKSSETVGLILEESALGSFTVANITEFAPLEVKSLFKVNDQIFTLNGCMHRSMESFSRSIKCLNSGERLFFAVGRISQSGNRQVFGTGECVSANFLGMGFRFGKVTSRHVDGSYDILFDHGAKEVKVSKGRIQKVLLPRLSKQVDWQKGESHLLEESHLFEESQEFVEQNDDNTYVNESHQGEDTLIERYEEKAPWFK